MRIGVGLSIPELATRGGRFSPASLFTSGVAGAWYDPSDVLLNWRTNLLTYSQEFDNAAWSKITTTVTANSDTAPDGTTTADTLAATGANSLVYQIVTGLSNNTAYTLSVWVKTAGSGATATLAFYTAGGGTTIGSQSFTTTGSWQRITLTATTGTLSGETWFAIGGASTFSTGESLYSWGAQLELGSTATTYQAITTPEQTYLLYDPQPVLYQDSAGTTPVTAVEQPVGLMLDKSQGATLGAEQYVTGTAPWSRGFFSVDGTISAAGTAVTITQGAGDTAGFRWVQPITCVVGRYYRLYAGSITLTGGTSALIAITSSSAGTGITSDNSISDTQDPLGKYIVATATTMYVVISLSGGVTGNSATFDNISVKAVAGNHASQATAASRPVLRARYNQLTYSEQFDNATAWTPTSATISPNTTATTDPLGGNTADSIIAPIAANSQHRVYQAFSASTYTLSIYAKAGTAGFISLSRSNDTAYATFNLSTGAVSASAGGTGTIESAGNGWWRCIFTSSVATSYFQVAIGTTAANAYPNAAWVGAGENVFLWGAQAVTGSSAGTYQRIAAATDYATAGFLPYLALDGADDFVASAAIDFTTTDEVTLCSGITKNSDALRGVFAHLGSGASATFRAEAPDASLNGFAFYTTGSGAIQGSQATGAAPATRVFTGIGDISADINLLRLNGVQVASNTADQGTGNYSNAVLNVGRRGDGSLFFNGRVYQFIVCGKTLSASELASTEAYVATKTGVTL